MDEEDENKNVDKEDENKNMDKDRNEDDDDKDDGRRRRRRIEMGPSQCKWAGMGFVFRSYLFLSFTPSSFVFLAKFIILYW